jgi:hypothetical protein
MLAQREKYLRNTLENAPFSWRCIDECLRKSHDAQDISASSPVWIDHPYLMAAISFTLNNDFIDAAICI